MHIATHKLIVPQIRMQYTACFYSPTRGLQIISGRDVVIKLQSTPVNFFSAPKKKLQIADCGVLKS